MSMAADPAVRAARRPNLSIKIPKKGEAAPEMMYLYQLKIINLRVIISMMVLCNANFVIEYDRKRPGLSSAPLDME